MPAPDQLAAQRFLRLPDDDFRRLLALIREVDRVELKVLVPRAAHTAACADPTTPRSSCGPSCPATCANVRGATEDPGIIKEPKGIRAPGAHVPGLFVGGTFHVHGERVFWDVHDPAKAVVIELADERYARLIIEVADPRATVALIEQATDRA
jgi:hypothetical protein